MRVRSIPDGADEAIVALRTKRDDANVLRHVSRISALYDAYSRTDTSDT
jgi:hypothetical protein